MMKNRQTLSRTLTRKNEETGNLRNEITCGGIEYIQMTYNSRYFEMASNSYRV